MFPLCRIGFTVEQAVQVDDLARRFLGVALCWHVSMMPIAIFVSGRFGPRGDDRWAVVAEWPTPA